MDEPARAEIAQRLSAQHTFADQLTAERSYFRTYVESSERGQLIAKLHRRIQRLKVRCLRLRNRHDFQTRVRRWVVMAFGDEVANDKLGRHQRFLEEALELVQAGGCTQGDAHMLVDYVYRRKAGHLDQEVGGVMVTLAALCATYPGVEMDECAGRELLRVCRPEVLAKVRVKQATKPRGTPLPGNADVQVGAGK